MSTKFKFFTRFDPPPSPFVQFEQPSLTDQTQKKDCDVNFIIERFRETGYLVDPMHPGTRKPIFGDFTDIPDYQGALDLLNRADAAFSQLPAKVRERFGNNPQEIFDFLSDEKNRDEAISLGLIDKPVNPSTVQPAADQPAAGQPVAGQSDAGQPVNKAQPA